MTETAIAALLHPTLLAIESIDLDAVPVFLLDRSASRKVQALTARALFRQLGLKGISVTAPNYSMAQAVHIHLPNTEYSPEERAEWNRCSSDSERRDTPYGRLRTRENAAEHKLEAILAKAFPNHLDRSDIMTDYFDFCWSVN